VIRIICTHVKAVSNRTFRTRAINILTIRILAIRIRTIRIRTIRTVTVQIGHRVAVPEAIKHGQPYLLTTG